MIGLANMAKALAFKRAGLLVPMNVEGAFMYRDCICDVCPIYFRIIDAISHRSEAPVSMEETTP